MKTLLAFIVIFTLTNLFTVNNASAQTVAIGHVSAEIVEAVSVSSQAVTNLAIGNASTTNSESLNLGNITVNSGNSVACNLVLKPATVSNTNGSSFTIETSANNSLLANSQSTIGNNRLSLTGNTNIEQGQHAGLYQGSYTIVFAYN